jgi:hypothetical protein
VLREAIEHGELAILIFFEAVFQLMVKKGRKDKRKLPDKSYRPTPREFINSLA